MNRKTINRTKSRRHIHSNAHWTGDFEVSAAYVFIKITLFFTTLFELEYLCILPTNKTLIWLLFHYFEKRVTPGEKEKGKKRPKETKKQVSFLAKKGRSSLITVYHMDSTLIDALFLFIFHLLYG